MLEAERGLRPHIAKTILSNKQQYTPMIIIVHLFRTDCLLRSATSVPRNHSYIRNSTLRINTENAYLVALSSSWVGQD